MLSKDVCFGRRMSVLSKDVCFVEGCDYHPPLGAFGPHFLLNDQCFVLCCRRTSVLSKDVCCVEEFMFCRRMYVLSKDLCFVERISVLSKGFCKLVGFM